MKTKTSIIMLSFCLFVSISCKRNPIILDVKFGLSKKQLNEKIEDLVKNKQIALEISEYDTIFNFDLNINNTIYKTALSFNNYEISNYPLISYEFDFTPMMFSALDTEKELLSISASSVCKEKDFINIKSFLDLKYGKPNEKSMDEEEVIFEYKTDDVDLFLTHYGFPREDFQGIPFKNKLYRGVSIKVQSKMYNEEIIKHGKNIKPDNVLRIEFSDLYFENNADLYNSDAPKINFKAKYTTYMTNLINDPAVECKGNLVIIDSYRDTLKAAEITYKFNPPLSNKQEDAAKYGYSINSTDPSYQKIKQLLLSGNNLRAIFKPTAIVMQSGRLIK